MTKRLVIYGSRCFAVLSIVWSSFAPMQPPLTSMTAPIRLGEPIPADALQSIQRVMQLRHFKWDTQVGDTSILFSQPLLMAQSTWDWLAAKAEKAAQEIYALEQLIAGDPVLCRRIGVPRALRKLLKPGASVNSLRVLRFDFHPTPNGWLLSEVNTDVPGGFGEASMLPALFRPFQQQGVTPPCPLEIWGEAVAAEVIPGHVALLCAPGHLEDQQVVLTLGRELARRGFTPHLVQSPAALHWRNGCARLAGTTAVRLSLVVRFFQAEWLARLPGRSGWRELFKPQSGTRLCHPSECVISESKRLPLCFEAAEKSCPTLRELWPECREPTGVNEADRAEWVLKAAYSNTGDEVHLGVEIPALPWKRLLRKAQRNSSWIAQRRFDTVTLASVRGPLKPCVGVFVVGSRAAGAYVRLSTTQVTNAHALEAPCFILPDEKLT